MGIMTNIVFTSEEISSLETDLLVVAFDDVEKLRELSQPLAADAELMQAKAEAGKCLMLPGNGVKAKRVALVGTGLDERARNRKYSLEDAVELPGTGAHRHYAAIGVRGSKAAKVALAGNYRNAHDAIQAGVGALVAAHGTNPYQTQDSDFITDLTIVVNEDVAAECEETDAANRIETLAQAMISTIDLVNRAPNDLYPQAFASKVEEVCAQLPIEVEIWDESRLAEENCGGILGVGQGSTRQPRLVTLRYNPKNAQRHVSLVGKGITFDSGGLSLKPAASMETMKSDMTGAASVLSAVVAAAKLNSQTAITAYLALAENMPSGSALRPCDVITMRNGARIEITNTDAEGRLVMADALSLAAETDTDAIVDIATLTGAQMVGLGVRVAGVMGTSEVRDQITSSAARCGEPMWAMPLPSYLRESLTSEVAQMKNSGSRWGGMLLAGVFLEEFVADKAWAHIDIAGPSFNEGSPWGANNKGATGMAVLTLVDFLQR
ncbi:MAG: leucyl aminopeptidase [Actinomycetaceae bacterium]|nr:leucyl aminopeptidase [Actinomycetaceae bacterium]